VVEISVVICSHNPRANHLRRTLDATPIDADTDLSEYFNFNMEGINDVEGFNEQL